MSKICKLTGKRPIVGNNISHANNKTKRRFIPNVHKHRFWIESEKKFIRLLISTKGIRLIDKLGIEYFIPKLNIKQKPKTTNEGSKTTCVN